jgi:uncharacterized membrane protein YhdT
MDIINLFSQTPTLSLSFVLTMYVHAKEKEKEKMTYVGYRIFYMCTCVYDVCPCVCAYIMDDIDGSFYAAQGYHAIHLPSRIVLFVFLYFFMVHLVLNRNFYMEKIAKGFNLCKLAL